MWGRTGQNGIFSSEKRAVGFDKVCFGESF